MASYVPGTQHKARHLGTSQPTLTRVELQPREMLVMGVGKGIWEPFLSLGRANTGELK